jgi:hypothetical protein
LFIIIGVSRRVMFVANGQTIVYASKLKIRLYKKMNFTNCLHTAQCRVDAHIILVKNSYPTVGVRNSGEARFFLREFILKLGVIMYAKTATVSFYFMCRS